MKTKDANKNTKVTTVHYKLTSRH